ncbi:MAG: DNA-binding response regulator, partial [Salana multivorans]|nr:DNA-binding response regulator [Salana multivorans]
MLRGVEAVLEGASGVRHVRSASSVAELLRDGVEDIDVVLLDVDLGDGSDAAENVRVLRDLGVQV